MTLSTKALILVVMTAFFCSGTSAQQDQKPGLQLTVYNNDLAVVKDRRLLTLPEGVGSLQFTDVPKTIDPTSVHFESLTDPASTVVLEQNYEYDLVSPTKLLDKYLDQQVTLITQDGEVHSGRLLTKAEDYVVLVDGNGGVQLVAADENLVQIRLNDLPEGLLTRPTLVWETYSETGGEHLCQVTYMTSQVSWTADYVLVIGDDDETVDLTGWVTLNNRSGATYRDAQLKLIAGDVNRVVEEPMRGRGKFATLAAAPMMEMDAGFEEESLFEYHLYTLQRPTTIRDNQTKQVSLLAAPAVPATKVYEFNGALRDRKVQVKVEFTNSEEANMGMPLPKGRVRAFQAGSDGALEFIGEDRIDHTPRNEKVRVLLGNAFDLVGERKQTHFQKITDRVQEETIEISLRNRKEDETVTIKVTEPQYGDWQIQKASHPYTRPKSGLLQFMVEVEPGAEEVVTYVIQRR